MNSRGGLVGYDAALTQLRSWVQFPLLVIFLLQPHLSPPTNHSSEVSPPLPIPPSALPVSYQIPHLSYLCKFSFYDAINHSLKLLLVPASHAPLQARNLHHSRIGMHYNSRWNYYHFNFTSSNHKIHLLAFRSQLNSRFDYFGPTKQYITFPEHSIILFCGGS